MSQYLNLLSRRIAADVFEATKGGSNFAKEVQADDRTKEQDEEGRDYIRIRAACWLSRWKSLKVDTPTALAEDPNISFDVPVSEQSVEVATKTEAKQDAKPKKASANKPEATTEG